MNTERSDALFLQARQRIPVVLHAAGAPDAVLARPRFVLPVAAVLALEPLADGGALVAAYLRPARLQTGAAETLFRRELRCLESICQGRQQVRVRHIPTALGQRLSGLPFDLDLPSLGEEGPVDAPPHCH